MIPEIVTGRLILRGWRRTDFAAYVALWQDPDVVRFTGGRARTEAESWGRFLAMAGHWPMEGFGQWAVTRRADDRLIGQTGFFRAMRGLGADFDTAPEAGWVLEGAAHGHGFGAEAVEAAHRWFDGSRHAGPLQAMIEPDNATSIRVAERFGYRPGRSAVYEGAAVVLLRRAMQV